MDSLYQGVALGGRCDVMIGQENTQFAIAVPGRPKGHDIINSPERISMTEDKILIAVIGGGSPPTDTLNLAYMVGRELSRRGAILVCGGLKGVMEAACRGAKEGGGLTVGILPGSDPSEANPYVDIPISTGMGSARNIIVVKSAKAVIAINGAYGTLSEIGHALGEGIPVIGLKTWGLSIDNHIHQAIIHAQDPIDAVGKAFTAAEAVRSADDRGKH